MLIDNPSLQQVEGEYAIRNKDLAAFGAMEVKIAEREMPALIAIREKYRAEQPLAGARIVGSIHMTIQTAVLVDTLIALGAEVSWTSCNIFSTQDHAAAYLAAKGVKVFAWKGQTNGEGEQCLHAQIAALPNANMILDDGGDLTLLIHDEYPEMLPRIYGVSEETTTGVHRLHKLLEEGRLQIPAINVNDSITKSKNDNVTGCRHSLNDAIKRGTDALLVGKRALVIGFGDVGKGSAASLKQEGMLVDVTEIDPICAMQANLNGYGVVSPYIDGDYEKGVNAELLGKVDLLVTTTGNINVCDFDMLKALKPGCIVCNIGHFDNEIDTASMREHWKWTQVKDQVHLVHRSPDEHDYLILLSEGRLVNLGNATGHPSRVMQGSFADQVLAQIELYREGKRLEAEGKRPEPRMTLLPKILDEEVARYMSEGFGGVITKLRPEQAEYIGVQVEGPYKPDTYHY